MSTPNLQALKTLLAASVDGQYVQQWGSQIFNYSGEPTDEYKNLCSLLSQALSNLSAEITQLQEFVPKFS